MELRQYFSIIVKWWWLVVLSVLFAAGSSYLASRAVTPLYKTKTTLMVGSAIREPDPNSAEMYTGQQLAYTYLQLARREPVLKGVIEKLGLQTNWQALAGQVSASLVYQTNLLEIYVVDSDPYRAKVLADAIAQQLIEQSPAGLENVDQTQSDFARSQLANLKTKIEDAQEEIVRLQQELDASKSAREIQQLESEISILDTKITGWQSTYTELLATLQGGNVNALSVIEEATVPTWPISPNIRMNVLLAAAIGLVLAVGGIFLIEYLDDTIKTSEDIYRSVELPVLGVIGKITGEEASEKLVAQKQPLSPVVEAYRSMRMNIQFSSLDKPIHTLMITSPRPKDGKTIILSNLAVVMAQSGLRVVLVDADMRRPSVHKFFSLQNSSGLSNAALQTHHDIADFLLESGVENLRILTSGPLPPSPGELLASKRFSDILEQLKKEADILLFDTPPCLLVADAAILGTRMDGALLVNSARRTRKSETRRAVDELLRVHINILGVILNRMSGGPGSYTGDEYYQYHAVDEKAERRNHKKPLKEKMFLSK